MTQSLRWFISTLLAGSLLPAITVATQTPCDPLLTPETNSTIQYRKRGGDLRCEGFYRASVSGSSLEVVGLLLRPLRFGAGDQVLRIGSPVRDGQVLVRGQGIPVKLYYRLDAELAPGGTLRWPLGLLQSQGIAPDRIGLYGRLADRPDWYVPLDIAGTQPPAERPRLLVRAAVDIEEVLWRYSSAPDGRCGVMTDWKRLAAPAGFAGGEAIPIDLPRVKKERQTCMEVAARTRRDGDWLKRLVKIQR